VEVYFFIMLLNSPSFIFPSFQLYHIHKLSSISSIVAYDVGVFSKVEVYLFVNLHLCYFSRCVILFRCTLVISSWVNIVVDSRCAFCVWP
jgi:hypothetical protein